MIDSDIRGGLLMKDDRLSAGLIFTDFIVALRGQRNLIGPLAQFLNVLHGLVYL